MTEKINREMLRHHVSHVMFCPLCSAVLDVRSAVSIDLMKNGELQKTHVMCTRCYDARAERLRSLAAQFGATIETLDGRTLYARGTH